MHRMSKRNELSCVGQREMPKYPYGKPKVASEILNADPADHVGSPRSYRLDFPWPRHNQTHRLVQCDEKLTKTTTNLLAGFDVESQHEVRVVPLSPKAETCGYYCTRFPGGGRTATHRG